MGRGTNKSLTVAWLLCITWVLSGTITAVFGQGREEGFVHTSVGVPPVQDIRKEIARRMRSGEISDRAWGVYLIGQHGLGEFSPALSELLKPTSEEESREMSLFYRVVLDSLIQLDATLPAEVLIPHYENFPDEVLILLAKRPEDHRQALLSLLKEYAGIYRIAVCNLLAAMRAPGFAVFLLRDLSVKVSVRIYDEHGLGFGGGTGGGIGVCGGGVEPPDPADFPPIARYELTDRALSGAVMLAPGRQPVYYVRRVGRPGRSYTGGGTRYNGGGNEDQTCTEYLAELLDTTTADLQFTPRPSYWVLWNGLEEYLREMARIRAEVEWSFERLVERLVRRGLLSLSEAAALRPRLSFEIHDHRSDTSMPLPDMKRSKELRSIGR